MKNRRMYRRELLASAGAAGLSLPFLPLLRTARADDAYPRRLLLMLGPLNGLQPGWEPSGTGSAFTLGERLRLLEPYRDKLLILSGVEGPVRDGFVDGHKQGMAGIWTGSPLNEREWPSSPSIDQILAREIGSQTAFPSLELGVMSHVGLQTVVARMAFGEGGSPIAPESDPYRLFDRIFGQSDDGTDLEAERLRRERRSVLDSVRASVERMHGRISAEERYKLDAHLEGIRTIERRLDGSDLSSAPGCRVPTFEGSHLDVSTNDNFPVLYRLQVDQMVAALACDRTRIVTFQPSTSISTLVFHWVPGITQSFHFGTMHGPDEALRIRLNDWFVEQFAYVLGALDAVPEGDGTLLDHTLVVWTSEMSDGAHGNYPVPYILAGAHMNGAFRFGRHLAMEGEPYTRVLQSILHAFGVHGRALGAHDDGRGPLTGLG